MAWHPGMGEEHQQLLTSGQKPRPSNRRCLQFYASVTTKLQSWRSEGRILEGDSQQRRVRVWRKWTRQPRRSTADAHRYHGRDHSISMTLPPFSSLFLKSES